MPQISDVFIINKYCNCTAYMDEVNIIQKWDSYCCSEWSCTRTYQFPLFCRLIHSQTFSCLYPDTFHCQFEV